MECGWILALEMENPSECILRAWIAGSDLAGAPRHLVALLDLSQMHGINP
jgi:hypothetical protein